MLPSHSIDLAPLRVGPFTLTTFRVMKDPWSFATHFAGLLAACCGAVALVAMSRHDPLLALSMTIYATAVVGVFTASSLYHFFDVGPRGNAWLRRLDHAAIFAMIAGSYVPPLMCLLDGPWRAGMLAAVLTFGVLGTVFKVAWITCPRWLGTTIYLAMGWIVVIPAGRIFAQLDASQIALLAAGGASYSLGSIVYVKQWPDPWPGRFGHHEVWHLFVLAGAALHFAFVATLLDHPIAPF